MDQSRRQARAHRAKERASEFLPQRVAQRAPKHRAARDCQWCRRFDFYELQPGDEIDAKDSPPIADRGFCLEASIEYNAAVDQNSTLISQGDDKDGWVLHLKAGCPTLTLYIGGRTVSFTLDELKPGPAMIRAQVPANGTVSLAVTDQSELIDEAPFPGGFPVQPKTGLKATQSFGPLKAKDYPNSTPFDGKVHRLTVEVLPAVK